MNCCQIDILAVLFFNIREVKSTVSENANLIVTSCVGEIKLIY